jgi:hypothetical protein
VSGVRFQIKRKDEGKRQKVKGWKWIIVKRHKFSGSFISSSSQLSSFSVSQLLTFPASHLLTFFSSDLLVL